MTVLPQGMAVGGGYDVRAPLPSLSPSATTYVQRAHCLHAGCHWIWEGDDSDRQARLHTEREKHPTACRTELAGVHRRH